MSVEVRSSTDPASNGGASTGTMVPSSVPQPAAVGDESNKMQHRTSLPSPMVPRDEISIFSILKHLIGKDLTKITMPIMLNEPLSFLQRLAEYAEYAELLNLADQLDDPVERLEAVCAFAVSSLSPQVSRMNKPFNPILGE